MLPAQLTLPGGTSSSRAHTVNSRLRAYLSLATFCLQPWARDAHSCDSGRPYCFVLTWPMAVARWTAGLFVERGPARSDRHRQAPSPACAHRHPGSEWSQGGLPQDGISTERGHSSGRVIPYSLTLRGLSTHHAGGGRTDFGCPTTRRHSPSPSAWRRPVQRSERSSNLPHCMTGRP